MTREEILKQFEPFVGLIPDEEEVFWRVCDLWDFCEVTDRIENKFSIVLSDKADKDEFCFDTVKDFVDWILTYNKTP